MNPRIGQYEFVTLARADNPRGGPPIPTEQCELITRPGVDGTAVLQLGKRAEPVVLRSFLDIPALSYVPTYLTLYRALIGTTVDLLWQDVDYTATYGYKFAVLDVQQMASGRLGAKSGGLNAIATAWLECHWTLVAMVGAT